MDDPIQEKQSLLERAWNKFKEFCRSFGKPKQIDYEKILENIRNNNEKIISNMSAFGMSCEQAGRALAEFNKAIPHNLVKPDYTINETTLYADGEPYCIINEKGDVVWHRKEK